MRSGCAVLIGALLAAAIAAGCGANTSGKSGGGSGGSGGGEDTGGSSGSTGGKSGTGGSSGATGGAGGSSATGGSSGGFDAGGFPDANPAGGAGGGFADASAGDGATGPLPPPPPPDPPCQVAIKAVRPVSFADLLPAGPDSRLRVQAEATGTQAPKMPAWKWRVQHVGSGADLEPTVVEMDPSMVEFPLATPGIYEITAEAAPQCTNSVKVSATDHPVSHLWLRIIPKTNLAQPMEGFKVDVPPEGASDQNVALGIGTVVMVEPREVMSVQRSLFSYVRITSPGSTVLVEGHTRTGALTAHLEPNRNYDVLVVPDTNVAPLVFRGRPAEINNNLFVLDPGITVSGQVSSSKGPANGARVLLRDGAVPSTTGSVDAGQYDLRVRSGSRFAAVIIPPPNAGLPEARLAAGSGLAIYDFPPGPRTLDFAWNAIDTGTLDLTVLDNNGAAVKSAVRVRLISDDAAFPDVGTLTLKVSSPTAPDQTFSYHPGGFVQEEKPSDARGFVSFANLPRGKYNAILTPTDGSAAITSASVDVSAARVTTSARLAGKVAVSGQLLPVDRTHAATLVALDPEADPTLAPPSAIIGADGGYILRLDPGRSYQLVLQAEPANGLPRTLLRSMVAPSKDMVREALTVGGAVPVSGRITGAAVAGVLVEAYCMGQPPSCIDPDHPDITRVRPIAETISDADGNYRLLVPDPSITY